jgi:hypothetical protein
MFAFAHARVKGFLFFGLIVASKDCDSATANLQMASVAILWMGMINHVEKKGF